jgi:hypothetical protein
MAEAMSAVYRGFDYTKSPEFRAQVADKPESFVAQRRRLASDPILLAEHRLRLKNALGALLTSREAYQLVPEDQHPRLRRIVTLAYNLANPGGEFRR